MMWRRAQVNSSSRNPFAIASTAQSLRVLLTVDTLDATRYQNIGRSSSPVEVEVVDDIDVGAASGDDGVVGIATAVAACAAAGGP